jgi:hypothetical protein
MLVRFFIAIAAGLLVGVIIYEGLLQVHGLFVSGPTPLDPLIAGEPLTLRTTLTLTCFWTLGASASSLMAGWMATHRGAGLLAAACWVMPLGLLIGLSERPAAFLSLALSIPVLAALISDRLGPERSGRTRT